MSVRDAYVNFFVKSEEGAQFYAKLGKLIDSYHESGEKKPDEARDYAMRASAIRDVIKTIDVSLTKVKK